MQYPSLEDETNSCMGVFMPGMTTLIMSSPGGLTSQLAPLLPLSSMSWPINSWSTEATSSVRNCSAYPARSKQFGTMPPNYAINADSKKRRAFIAPLLTARYGERAS